ncbi:D-alanyl-D-alanine carboxypeptidase family protein [Oceanivirga salmonicida]|uniref:D-alanyl-D-alanine carboxypeptidase family protein n=1 Tax=Oceanivirga salmonicida TaxID=1769291 RepID=UPI000831C075|nr:D-alanyl-D-alanine carboxypeptidase family protein [Oceanivirga salmonicida]
MKKIYIICIIFLQSILSFTYKSAYSALDNGIVILSEDADTVRPIASLTKLMTVAVALDSIDIGETTLFNMVKIDYDSTRGSSLPIFKGDLMSVEDLIKAALIYSENNAAYTLSTHISKTEDEFVKRMNAKAKRLGMNDTKFYTSTGLPTNYTQKKLDVSTAKDMYKLANYLIKDKRVVEWASQKHFELKGKSYKSRNKIIGENGNFGLKTGFHRSAGFNMIGTNKIENNTLIVVTFADETLKGRFDSQLKISGDYIKRLIKIYDKNTIYKKIAMKNSREKYLITKLENDFYYHNSNIKTKEKIYELTPYIRKGDIVGEFLIYNKDILVNKINIIADTNLTKLSFWGKIKYWLGID